MAETGQPPTDVATVLRGIVAQHPSDVWQNAQALQGLLADRQLAGEDAALILSALAEGIPDRIVRERADTPRAVLAGVLRERLVDGQGLGAERAAWVADLWLKALQPDAARASAQQRREQPQPTNGDDDHDDDDEPKRPLAAATLIGAVVVAIVAVWWLQREDMAALEVQPVAIDVFASETEPVDLDAPVSKVSTCHVSAMQAAEPCKTLAEASSTVAFVGVDQTVTLMVEPSARRRTVAGSCEIRDAAGRLEAEQTSEATLPAALFGEPQRAIVEWRTAVARPRDGWATGRHTVSCQSPLVSWSGSFDVAP